MSAKLAEATRKVNDKYSDIPNPQLPPALDGKPAETVLKPEDMRALIQLNAQDALDMMRFHALNIKDPKSSIAACQDLLDRAGFVPPAKGKAGEVVGLLGGEGGLPPVEDDVRKLGSAFASMGSEE